ncbi:RNA polymerase sigma factor [Actinomycetospora termitidis]|uniref:RNA polymerase sigma factor n=1 Tax=Actinomycetospora termitidis TaxID=3053470 RepID=A0ABT7ME08_9PSEU|nr:RNA polymerase sigma factor [Actinomycetospora sp. Odt1-22]MDL5158904.1 RNA polymerase sigma factor [Actinomycetospora sp. Odt1-22]
MVVADADGVEGWLGDLLRRFDPGWMPPVEGLASDREARGGLQRISATDARGRLDRLIAFYEQERPKLLAFARRTLGTDADLADDLLQEVMRKICQKPPVMREPDKEAPFFYQAIRNEAVTQGTRAGRERSRREQDEDAAAQVPDDTAAVEDPVVFHLVLARALATLSPRERDLVELVDIRQMTIKDAAVELGISLGTAKNYRFVALRRLRADPGLGDLRTAA